ncbi:MAG: hypothetical protein QW146_02760 [Candidatus Bathyarchaeia archaeon]
MEKGEKGLTEHYSWLFIDLVPLLYERRRVAKQLQVETWLDLSQLLRELKLENAESSGQNAETKRDYVI